MVNWRRFSLSQSGDTALKIHEHLLSGARQWQSPHQDERATTGLDLIVVHGISLPPGEFGSGLVRQLFCGELNAVAAGLPDLEGLRVSSHVLIDREGRVDQFVPFDRRAWHAGLSSWRGREVCNDFSIGIELEGTDLRRYEPVQYAVLAEVCTSLIHTYGMMDIAGHCHIAPGRKTDPGPAFDWRQLRGLLAARL